MVWQKCSAFYNLTSLCLYVSIMLSESHNPWLSKRKNSVMRATATNPNVAEERARLQQWQSQRIQQVWMPAGCPLQLSHGAASWIWRCSGIIIFVNPEIYETLDSQKRSYGKLHKLRRPHFFGCDNNMSSNTHLQCIVEYLWCLHRCWHGSAVGLISSTFRCFRLDLLHLNKAYCTKSLEKKRVEALFTLPGCLSNALEIKDGVTSAWMVGMARKMWQSTVQLHESNASTFGERKLRWVLGLPLQFADSFKPKATWRAD